MFTCVQPRGKFIPHHHIYTHIFKWAAGRQVLLFVFILKSFCPLYTVVQAEAHLLAPSLFNLVGIKLRRRVQILILIFVHLH